MKYDIIKLINSDYSLIIADGDLSLLLLRVYSYLFLGGGQPRACTKCMNDYHQQIISQGLKQLEKMENKTCKMVQGVFYVAKHAVHYSDNNMSDELAVKLLKDGLLLERHFEVLPEIYVNKPVQTIELVKSNKGKFTEEILKSYKTDELKMFAKSIGYQANNKTNAVSNILKWQDN